MDIRTIGFIPLSSFPFPYKYLIGVGFYFYVKSHIGKLRFSPKEYVLFLPAIVYGLLRSYWYINLHSGTDPDIFWRVYSSGFFLYNEFVYLLFNLALVLKAIFFIAGKSKQIEGPRTHRNYWKWLTTFSWVFVGVIGLNILHQILAHILHLEHSGLFYYVILILNSIFIYWIGFIGFHKSNLLFKTFHLKKENPENTTSNALKDQLEYLFEVDEIFTRQNLKVSDVAAHLNISAKKLSFYLLENYDMTFSDFINTYRIEKVKMLLQTTEQEKYTLLAIAEKSGFSSKSSFNAVFKKITGLTPTQYKASRL
ncbi:helix-turn-helix domain-containing protein [Spongiimicrobium salis]|uniref:helix-turn-helix domain-containing protein n=1 Tax=Spongiimicrobium salis TaxID=1667022 RepID=UPI00374CF697